MPTQTYLAYPWEIDGIIQGVVADVVREVSEMDYSDILEEQIPFLEEVHSQYFEQEVDPTGKPWAPLTQKTLDTKGTSRILVNHSVLMNSLTQQSAVGAIRNVNGPTLEFGTNVSYSIYHQQDCGGSAGPLDLTPRQARKKALALLKRRVKRREARTLRGRLKKVVRKFIGLIGAIRAKFGGQVKTKTRARRRRKRMPARPHVGLSVDRTDEMVGKIADSIVSKMRR